MKTIDVEKILYGIFSETTKHNLSIEEVVEYALPRLKMKLPRPILKAICMTMGAKGFSNDSLRVLINNAYTIYIGDKAIHMIHKIEDESTSYPLHDLFEFILEKYMDLSVYSNEKACKEVKDNIDGICDDVLKSFSLEQVSLFCKKRGAKGIEIYTLKKIILDYVTYFTSTPYSIKRIVLTNMYAITGREKLEVSDDSYIAYLKSIVNDSSKINFHFLIDFLSKSKIHGFKAMLVPYIHSYVDWGFKVPCDMEIQMMNQDERVDKLKELYNLYIKEAKRLIKEFENE